LPLSLRTKLLVTGIFLCVALGATIFFAVQTIQAIQRFQEEHALTLAGDVSTIRPWMTIPYIARVYHVPESYLYERLHITDPQSVRLTSLHALAGRYNLPVDGLISDVQNAIRTYRNQHPHDATASLYIDTLLALERRKL
jgi:hypothetical protein